MVRAEFDTMVKQIWEEEAEATRDESMSEYMGSHLDTTAYWRTEVRALGRIVGLLVGQVKFDDEPNQLGIHLQKVEKLTPDAFERRYGKRD